MENEEWLEVEIKGDILMLDKRNSRYTMFIRGQ